MSDRLAGKVAVVTGAGSGIGRAICQRFAAEGASVVAGDLEPEGLERLAAALGERGATLVGDLSVEADVAALHQLAVDRFGRLDVAIANVGRGAWNHVTDQPLEEWQFVIDTSLTASFLALKHAGQRIVDGGSIVAIASLNAVQPAAGMAAYCAAKAGVAMLVRCAALGARRSGCAGQRHRSRAGRDAGDHRGVVPAAGNRRRVRREHRRGTLRPTR